MNSAQFQAMPLRLQLLLRRAGPLACGALALLAIGVVALAVALSARARQERLESAAAATAVSAPATLVAPAPVATADQNLALFYDTLGDRRYAEQQVKTLFALAAKSGLTLSQGEYKAGYDQASRVDTYQVTLPVKGSYQAIWQFALQSLRAIPFASLDELSFKRETIGDPLPEARLRLTFYLKSVRPAVQP